MAARRVREHIEGALSKFEAAIESARQTLVTQIDGSSAQGAVCAKDFLEDYREWERWHHPPEDSETKQDEKLRAFPMLKALRDKEWWTFEEADKVRELCRAEKTWHLASRYDHEGLSALVFDKLSPEMESVTARYVLDETWKFYNEAKGWLVEFTYVVKGTRRIIGRESPLAMFREFFDSNWENLRSELFGLNRLKNYGYDLEMVVREAVAAGKLIAKEAWEKCYEKELEAAQAFAWLEEAIREQRYKEWRRILKAL